jgi:hypothetical protein
MSRPRLERHGDTFALAWDSEQIAIGVERLRDGRSDGLVGELTVESLRPDGSGRVHGPVQVNLLSSETQTRLANTLAKRVNGLSPEAWGGIVTQCCALVAKAWREPTPVVDLATYDTRPIQYVIDKLLPQDDTTVLYGDGESGKSILVQRVAISIVTGCALPWGDRPNVTGPVLYLDWETNPNTVANRLQRLGRGLSLVLPPNQFHYRYCQRSLVDELPAIREQVSRLGVVLVVVDSIGYAADGALVEDLTARTVMNGLRSLSPVCRLAIAHVSAKTATDKTSAPGRPFGSTFFWNSMRSGIEVRRSEDDDDPNVISMGIYHQKSNDPGRGGKRKPFGLALMFDDDGREAAFEMAEIRDIPDLAERTPLSQRLRQLLSHGAMTKADLAEETGANPDTIAKTLRRMPDVIRVDRGGQGSAASWGLQAP